MEKCSYGMMNDEECHTWTYVSISGKSFIRDFDPVQREVLMWSSGLSLINADADVCLHHEHVLLKRYELMQKRCCDPFQSHQKPRKGGLRAILLAQAKEMCLRGYVVIPGYKLCPPCRVQYAKLAQASDSESVSSCEEGDVQAIEQDVSVESTRTSLNSTLQDIDLSPLKLHSVAPLSRLSVGKGKVNQVEKAMSDKDAKALKLNPDQLAFPDYVPEFSTDIEKKANDLDYLVSQVKMKMQTANRRQKIQILTLTPKSWTLRQAKKHCKRI